jgi:hypothetical protein
LVEKSMSVTLFERDAINVLRDSVESRRMASGVTLRPVLFTGNMLPMLIDAVGDQARMCFLEFFTVAWSPSGESRMNSGRATVVVIRALAAVIALMIVTVN